MVHNKLMECGVDWLTVTTESHAGAGLVEQKAIRLIRREEKRGARCRPWGMAGYVGYSAGSVQVGSRRDGCIVRLGGEVAKKEWKQFHLHSDNCSRIDCQLTVVAHDRPIVLLEKEYRRARKVRQARKSGNEVTWLTSSTEAASLYLGQRTSERFGRVYNKEAESGEERYRGTVRYEVEFKGGLARRIAQHLAQAENEAAACCGLVLDFMQARLNASPLVQEDLPWLTSTLDAARLSPMARTVAQSLEYIRKCIRPLVHRLLLAGFEAELLAALALTVRDNKLHLGPLGPTNDNASRR